MAPAIWVAARGNAARADSQRHGIHTEFAERRARFPVSSRIRPG